MITTVTAVILIIISNNFSSSVVGLAPPIVKKYVPAVRSTYTAKGKSVKNL